MITREMRRRIEAIVPQAAGADHIDVKSAVGNATLRECVSRMLSYKPGWYRGLFALRGRLAGLLGLRHDGLCDDLTITAENLGFAPGDQALFFTVTAAREEEFWAAEASDKHLRAWIAVFFDEFPHGARRYHAATCVVYENALGPVYFNLIRPFHHLIAAVMLHHAVKARP